MTEHHWLCLQFAAGLTNAYGMIDSFADGHFVIGAINGAVMLLVASWDIEHLKDKP